MKLILLGLGVAAALGWAAGCGGNVVVDEAAGGGGGSGSTSSGGPSSSNATGSSTGPGGPTGTTGTGGNGQLCASVCELLEQLQCTEDNCVESCLDAYAQAPGCAPQLDAYIVCLLQNTTSCGAPPVCDGALSSWEQCANGGCGGDLECWAGPDGSCGCKGFCSGAEVGVECAPDPSGLFTCQCALGGQVIATCQEPNPSCSIESGCCAPFFP
jgi:hypothetical protein